MKIVYFSKASFPAKHASSIHIINMCEALSSLGHEVHLMAPDHGSDENDIFRFYGVKSRFKIHLHNYPVYKGKTLIYLISAIRALIDIKPDFIVSRFSFGSYVSALFGYQTIHDFHGDDWNKDALTRNVYERLFRSCNLKKLTFNSHALKKLYLSSYPESKLKLEVLHNGCKIHDLKEKTALPGTNSIKAGYFGNLYEGRGIELIIEIAEALAGIDFIIVGGSEQDLRRLKSKVKTTNIYFMGFLEPSKVHLYRNSVDILLAPYMDKVALEGGQGDSVSFMNPVKLIEYMGSRKIIMTSDLPAIREILDDSKAILLNNQDSKAWIRAISEISNDKNKFSHLADNAYNEFLKNLTWESRASKMVL